MCHTVHRWNNNKMNGIALQNIIWCHKYSISYCDEPLLPFLTTALVYCSHHYAEMHPHSKHTETCIHYSPSPPTTKPAPAPRPCSALALWKHTHTHTAPHSCSGSVRPPASAESFAYTEPRCRSAVFKLPLFRLRQGPN